jgi:predicted nucleic acid-binding protein
MPPLSVYVETSVWSVAFANDVPEYTRRTLEFFEVCRKGIIRPHISGVVLEEIADAEPNLRDRILGLVREIKPVALEETAESVRLAEAFIRERVVPAGKPLDALHVAIAFIESIDVLTSWNFRHIASVRRSERFNAVAILEGIYKPLRIVSPPELIYDD